MFQSSLLILVLVSALSACFCEVTLLAFDTADKTSYSQTWQLTNDPVMGGVSYSNWTVDDSNKKGVWKGAVKIVPSLNAPGFCNVMSEKKAWNDAVGYSHMIIKARSTIPYKGFKVSFAADTLNMQFKCFKADFIMESTGKWEYVAIPFNQFSNNWSSYTGEPIVTCAADPSVCPTDKSLKDIAQIGFWMEGAEGDFDFEVESIKAGNI